MFIPSSFCRNLCIPHPTIVAMAGLGRRTHYRKHLTDSVLYDLPEPKDDERIAKVVATRGGNQFDIILAKDNGDDSTSGSHGHNEPGLAILPTKFHKLVWVKRNDYVIVQTGIDATKQDGADDDKEKGKEEVKNSIEKGAAAETSSNSDPNKTGIRFIITHILYKDQVKHLISTGLWPTHDPEFPVNGTTAPSAGESNDTIKDDDGIACGTDTDTDNYNDGIVYTEYDMDNDDDLFVNTNRISRLEIQDSDSEDSSDEED